MCDLGSENYKQRWRHQSIIVLVPQEINQRVCRKTAMGVTYLTCFFFMDFSADLSALSLPAIRDLVTSLVHWIWLAVINICVK